ncbi:MAG TPA: TlpA disulfide reductase family protein [Candidatus Acidoferrum sp.]|nr:TlpA disulfide reductase family protein [Candidatus Acidoferrum sp.]
MGVRWVVARLAQAGGSEYYSKWARIPLAATAPLTASAETMSDLSQILASKTGTRIFSALVLVVAVGVVVLFAAPSYRQGEASVAGRIAPDFTMEFSGRPAHLSDFRGKVVVLNFWFSTCPPCVEEIDSLNALQRSIAPHGATILGINTDEDESAYKKFLIDHKVVFPNYRDESKTIAATYGTAMFPETYIIGPDGRIMRKIISAQDWNSPEITSYIESLIPVTTK